jgi:hypothetical protein
MRLRGFLVEPHSRVLWHRKSRQVSTARQSGVCSSVSAAVAREVARGSFGRSGHPERVLDVRGLANALGLDARSLTAMRSAHSEYPSQINQC